MGKPIRRNHGWALILAAILLLNVQPGAAAEVPADTAGGPVTQVRARIEQRIQELSEQGQLICYSEPLCAVQFIPAFYRQRQFNPIWIDTQGLKPTAHLLMGAVRQAERDGLRSADYHLQSLDELLPAAQNFPVALSSQQTLLWADLDILLTDAFLLLTAHLSKGRVNPESFHSDWLLADNVIDLDQALRSAESEPLLDDLLRRLRPNHHGYSGLQDGLVSLRLLAAQGGWPQVSGETSLRVGERDPRVPALRRRLAISGHLSDQSAPHDPNLYDSAMEAAVRGFQKQHGLKPDGVVGRNSMQAMNVTVEERIRQIELNLERWRWLPRDLGQRYIVVNTAGFNLKMIENNSVNLEMRVVVGRPARKTPVFSTPMSYLVLNPYWNVPHKIAVEDILPQIRKQGVGYLAKQKIKLYNGWGQDAHELNPWTVNWASYNKHHFPFRFRQEPGSSNSLGSIKFILPNKFAVYLHDTPNRALFDLEKRDHSSGCIRVENAFDLAVEVLKNDLAWPPEKLRTRLKEGRTQVVYLKEPVPVHLIYLTAWVDEENVLQFREDIYNRDQSLDRALKKKDAVVSQTILSTSYPVHDTRPVVQ